MSSSPALSPTSVAARSSVTESEKKSNHTFLSHAAQSNPFCVQLFWALLSILVVLICILLLIEVPFGSVTHILFRALTDFDGNTRFMCGNCTYLVNRMDIIGQRKGTKVKFFDAYVRAVCPAPGSQSFSEANQWTPEQVANHVQQQQQQQQQHHQQIEGDDDKSATGYIEPMLLVSSQQGFCRDLFVYYREPLRARFRQLVRARQSKIAGSSDQLSQQPQPREASGPRGSRSSSKLVHMKRIVDLDLSSAPDFCSNHCQPNGAQLSLLFERIVLEFVDYIQHWTVFAGVVAFLRDWGRLMYLGMVLVWAMGVLLWWRRLAGQSAREWQRIDQKRAQLAVECAVLRGALQTEPWCKLIYSADDDPDIVRSAAIAVASAAAASVSASKGENKKAAKKTAAQR